MKPAIYLDHNATSPVRPEAADAVAAALMLTGNPSSAHGFGRQVRKLMEDAREKVAALAEASAGGVIFTSGGTEANDLALNGAGRRRVLVSAVEHPAVLDARADAEIIPVDGNGVVDLQALDDMLAASEEPALVSIMAANNETGVIQPVAIAADIAHARGALFHTDAVQAAGKIPIGLKTFGADMLTLTAHKMGGPMGVGALVHADGVSVGPRVLGGGQERRRRAGTENVSGIAGFGAVVETALQNRHSNDMAILRDGLEVRVKQAAPEAVIIGENADRLPNTSCIALPGVSSQTQVMTLDLVGFAVSSGSACSSGKVSPSHVLKAMALSDDLASSFIRISLGWTNTQEDLELFVEAWNGLRVETAANGISVAPAA
ncbi:MAG: cysteine desulfurase [Rhodospirillales bacterium]|nr:cysteine desulfurase [Rhodospirillales bacterium]